MAAAGLMTLLCHRLRQPVVIGYLLAGLIIGPYTPPFSLVKNLASIHEMAELGLVFLMFALGLEFNLPKIKKVGISAGVAALVEVAGMLAIGFLLGKSFGWSRTDSLFLGAILSISSTTIIVKVFSDLKMTKESFAQLVFGILIIEDIVAVAILSILSGLGTSGGPDLALVLKSILRISLFIILFLVLGLLLLPKFIHYVARVGTNEVLGIVVLGICLGVSMLAAALDLSIALGAFLAGAVLAASEEIDRIEEWIHPVRDMFSAIFFVSAGMLIQPSMLWQYKVPILVVTGATIIGKVVSGGVGAFVAGYDLKTSSRVGMSVAQIGEFSFVIASLGLSLNVTSDFLYPMAVAVSSLTTLATPYLIRKSDRLVEFGLQVMPVSMRNALDGYQRWFERKIKSDDGSNSTEVLSKYVVRLAVYGALVIVTIGMTRVFAIVAPSVGGVIWLLSGFLCLPLFSVFARYASHMIFLSAMSSRTLIQKLNPHSFYAVCEWTVLILCALFFYKASNLALMPAILAVLMLAWFLLKRPIRLGHEWLERCLDDITGLATSEPSRREKI